MVSSEKESVPEVFYLQWVVPKDESRSVTDTILSTNGASIGEEELSNPAM